MFKKKALNLHNPANIYLKKTIKHDFILFLLFLQEKLKTPWKGVVFELPAFRVALWVRKSSLPNPRAANDSSGGTNLKATRSAAEAMKERLVWKLEPTILGCLLVFFCLFFFWRGRGVVSAFWVRFDCSMVSDILGSRLKASITQYTHKTKKNTKSNTVSGSKPSGVKAFQSHPGSPIVDWPWYAMIKEKKQAPHKEITIKIRLTDPLIGRNDRNLNNLSWLKIIQTDSNPWKSWLPLKFPSQGLNSSGRVVNPFKTKGPNEIELRA